MYFIHMRNKYDNYTRSEIIQIQSFEIFEEIVTFKCNFSHCPVTTRCTEKKLALMLNLTNRKAVKTGLQLHQF